MSRGPRRRGDLRRTITMFRTYSAGQRRSFIGAVLLMALEAATAIVVPIVIGDLTDHLVRKKPWARLGLVAPADLTIPLFAAAIIAFTAVNSLSDAMSEISLAKAGRTLGYNLRAALFAQRHPDRVARRPCIHLVQACFALSRLTAAPRASWTPIRPTP